MNENASPGADDYRAARLAKVQALRDMGVNPYARDFPETTPIGAVVAGYREDADEEQPVRVAGRMRALRDMGKSAFADLADAGGKVQLYIKRKIVGDDAWRVWKLLDIGDIVGVAGVLFRTRAGELSVEVRELRVLTKAIRQAPMGKSYAREDGARATAFTLQDTETRYRRRYLDLLSNEESRAVFVTRSRMVSAMRRAMDQRGYMEVETPMMHAIPGGAKAKPFITHHNALDMSLSLRIAPELYLKRLLVGGLERVYEIGRNFRNEGLSTRHNPEFTMLEAYQAFGTYETMMTLTEDLVMAAHAEAGADEFLEFGERRIHMRAPFRRATYRDLVAEHNNGMDMFDRDAVSRRAADLNLDVAGLPFESALNEVFEHSVEPALIDPTFVIDYPTAICPLTKEREDDPRLCERFELFIGGMEMANAFSELNDPVDQHQRFKIQVESRDEEAPPEIDLDYVEALEYGMPPAGGLGIGIDRLVMLLCGRTSIRDVILFPTLRPSPNFAP